MLTPGRRIPLHITDFRCEHSPMHTARTIAAIALLIPSAQGFANDAVKEFSYHRIQVADGIDLFAEQPGHSIVSGNIIAISGKDATLVFDTGHHPSVSTRIAAELRRFEHAPVRYLVNSHWHDDHWTGNAQFVKAFPGARVIAQQYTADMIASRHEAFRGPACRADLEKNVAPYREMLRAGKRPDGSALSDVSRQRLQQAVREVVAQEAECDRMIFHGVDIAFDSGLDVDLGGRVVQLRFLGPANTAGDVIAYIPDANVVLTGDVVVHPFPFATGAHISQWARVLDQIAHMHATTIIPGHGEIEHDTSYVALLKDLMISIDAQVRAVYRPGATLEQIAPAIHLEPFREKIAGDDKLIQINFDYMMQLAVDRSYQEISGTMKEEAPS
jgi:cyclase